MKLAGSPKQPGWTKSLALVAFAFASAAQASDTYQVTTGDTLSEIAQRRLPQMKVYGADGSLARVLAENPRIMDPDRIFAGQRISLPSVAAQPALASAQAVTPAPAAPTESPRSPNWFSRATQSITSRFQVSQASPTRPEPVATPARPDPILALDLFRQADAEFARGESERALDLTRRSLEQDSAWVPARLLEVRALARVGQASVAQSRLDELVRDSRARGVAIPAEVFSVVRSEISRVPR